jgi:predicted unusual protein kinase regulating ubiquinone biosynthesis (AarF/ABC1/UbiB family)
LTRDKLNEDNAEDIYDGLKSLKGSALKVAQMLSMDKNFYPKLMLRNFVINFRSSIIRTFSIKNV